MGDLIRVIFKEEQQLSGLAKCFGCKHEWDAIAPIGTVLMECPNCLLEKGRFYREIQRTDLLHWHCKCGCDLFYITQEGCYCPNCGEWQKGF
jgi:hypothetical protein